LLDGDAEGGKDGLKLGAREGDALKLGAREGDALATSVGEIDGVTKT